MTENIPINDVDVIKSYIEMTRKMIKRIESGDVRPTDPELNSLKAAIQDLTRRLEGLKN